MIRGEEMRQILRGAANRHQNLREAFGLVGEEEEIETLKRYM